MCPPPPPGFTGTFPCLSTLPEVQRPTLNHAAPSTQGAAVLRACTQHSSAAQAHAGPQTSPLPSLEMLCCQVRMCSYQRARGFLGVLKTSRTASFTHPIICGFCKHCVLGTYYVPSAVLEANVLLIYPVTTECLAIASLRPPSLQLHCSRVSPSVLLCSSSTKGPKCLAYQTDSRSPGLSTCILELLIFPGL